MKIRTIILILFLTTIELFASGLIENKGQFPSDIKYISNVSPNFTFAITRNAFLIDNHIIDLKQSQQEKRMKKSGSLIELNFEDANFNDPEILEKSNAYYNFIKGNDPTKWVSGLYEIRKIKFNNIYPNIDLLIYFEGERIRYDLHCNENSDPDQIAININGAKDLLSDQNSLIINTGIGEIKSDGIYAYQEINNEESKVQVAFELKGDKLKFNIEEFDKNKKLVIDPLLYATVIGGIQNDVGEDLAVDTLGNIYITGYTSSFNFPSTIGVYNEDLNIEESKIEPDAFVTKFNSDNDHIFTTFIGGVGAEHARSCAVSKNDQHVLITGYTFDAENFPTTDTFDPFPNGAIDAFLLKLSNNGKTLIWSTLIGGSSDDFSLSVESSSDGSPVITGYTNIETTTPFPATTNSFQDLIEGDIDGFVAKFTNDGKTLLWSGLLGGINDDFPQTLYIDKDDIIHVIGSTRSVNFYTTPRALDRTYNDAEDDQNVSDVFYSKISANGSNIIYSTFLGGSKKDIGYGVVVDTSGYVYLTGATESFNYPVTDFAYAKEINNGNQFADADDIFVSKLNRAGDSLIFSTFIGGQAVDRAFGIDLDEYNNVYLTGNTNSFDLPTSLFAFDRSFSDTANYSDTFIMKLNKAGDTLHYSTYYGGELADLSNSIKVLREDVALITGTSSSTYLPTTKDALQSSHQDSAKSDVFFLTLLMDNLTDADYIICKGESIQVESGLGSDDGTMVSWEWSPSAGLNDDGIEFPIASPDETTQYTIVATDRFGEKYISTVLVSVVPAVNTYIDGDIGVPNGLVRTYQAPFRYGSNYEWSIQNGEILTGNGTNYIAVRWLDADNGYLKVVETNDFGCTDSAEIYTYYVSTWKMNIVPFGDYDLCEGDSIVYDAGDNYSNISWNDGTEGRYDTVYTKGTYYFTALDSNSNFYRSKNATVLFLPKPSPPKIVYQADSLYFLCLTAGSAFQWYKDGQIIEGATERKYRTITPGNYFLEITNRFGCRNISESYDLLIDDIEEQVPNILIFPNPTDDQLNIILPEGMITNAIIYDQLGNRISSKEINGPTTLDVSGFSPGVYFIQIRNRSFKFIVYR